MTKNVLIGLLGIAIGACGAAVAPAVMPAQATSAQRCDYTYLNDGETPDIGYRGALVYDEDWRHVLDLGFVLKAVDDEIYLFERCR